MEDNATGSVDMTEVAERLVAGKAVVAGDLAIQFGALPDEPDEVGMVLLQGSSAVILGPAQAAFLSALLDTLFRPEVVTPAVGG